MRQCTTCKEFKDISLFCKRGLKITRQCKACKSNYDKRYRELNKDRLKKQSLEYYKNNKELLKLKVNSRYHLNREVELIRRRAYRLKNKDKIREATRKYVNRRCKVDLDFKIKRILSSRIYKALKGQVKSDRSISFIGCSISKLKQHLESMFSKDMTWDNYGKWHIDHIKPCAAFDLTIESQQRECFHYTNLQPLWAEDNLKKGAKWNTEY